MAGRGAREAARKLRTRRLRFSPCHILLGVVRTRPICAFNNNCRPSFPSRSLPPFPSSSSSSSFRSLLSPSFRGVNLSTLRGRRRGSARGEMKLEKKKLARLFSWRSRSGSKSSSSSLRASGASFGSASSSASSSKSPQETPTSVLAVTYTASAQKASPSSPTTAEICIEEPSYVRAEEPAARRWPLPAPAPTRGVEELREVFKVFDANGDGKISVAELGLVLRSLGDDPSEEELRLMVMDADTDGDGCIGLEEFIALNSKPAAGADPATDELRDAFCIFDADRNGLISAEELQRVLRSIGDDACTLDDCRRMIRAVDRDGDGHVDFEEFRIMMTC